MKTKILEDFQICISVPLTTDHINRCDDEINGEISVVIGSIGIILYAVI